MKTRRAFVPLVLLAACAAPPADPIGRYRLDTADKTLVLDVRASGDYVLQIDGPDSMTDEIRGRWKDEQRTSPQVSFHGLMWRGTQPEAGAGIWTATLQGNADICLDTERQACFAKDDAA